MLFIKINCRFAAVLFQFAVHLKLLFKYMLKEYRSTLVGCHLFQLRYVLPEDVCFVCVCLVIECGTGQTFGMIQK